MAGNLNKAIERLNRIIGQLLKQNERQIARRYAHALVEIRGLLAGAYERYEQGGKLTYADMAKYDRLRKLMVEITRVMNLVHKDVAAIITKALGAVYEEGYYMTAWAVETEAKALLAYSTVSPDTILAAINNPVSGLKWSERHAYNRAYAIQRIQEQVTQGLVAGETYSSMSKRITAELNISAFRAVRIARTEGHRVIEQAKHDSASHADKQGVIMLKEWNSLEDERVRPGRGIGKPDRGVANHRKLNGVKVDMSGTFNDGASAGPAPGLLPAASSSINCRCFLTYSIAGIERKTHDTMETLAFDEWKKERLRK